MYSAIVSYPARRTGIWGLGFGTVAAAALGLCVAGTPAHATVLVADGLSYDLTTGSLSGTSEQFTLTITGINGPNDLENGGRYGFDSVAFTQPSNYSTASAVTAGFSEEDGGLSNATGQCNGSGNFFCFKGFDGTSGTVLASNSSLTFVFNVNLSSGDFTGWVPDLKIDWVGTNNNYDLVSQNITPDVTLTPPNPPPVGVPEPSTLALLGGLLLALFGVRSLKRA